MVAIRSRAGGVGVPLDTDQLGVAGVRGYHDIVGAAAGQ